MNIFVAANNLSAINVFVNEYNFYLHFENVSKLSSFINNQNVKL